MSKKPSILLVDDEPLILQILEISIQSELEVEIFKANNGSEAKEILKKTPDISLIVSDYFMPKGTGGDLYLFNKENNNLPFILLSGGEFTEFEEMADFQEVHPKNVFLTKPTEGDEILSAIKNGLEDRDGSEVIVDLTREERGFKKVKPYFLTKLAKSDFDLFMKMGEGKFLQVTTKENKDMKSVLSHYESKEKDIHFFYLSESDYDTFFEQVNTLLEDFKNNTDTTIDKTEVTFTTLDFAFSVAQEHLDALGVSKIHQNFIDSSLDRICGDLKKNKDLLGLLGQMLKHDDYLSEHSILNIYFSSYLLTKLNWATDQTLKQMLYASFYHDIEIQNQDLAKKVSLEDCSDKEEEKIVKNHGIKAAQLIEKLPGMNTDAHKIILDHHERPDGKGFPLGLTASNIPPLSCVFILSHEIVDFLIFNNFQTQLLASKIQEMESHWSKGNFKRPFECLRSILMD